MLDQYQYVAFLYWNPDCGCIQLRPLSLCPSLVSQPIRHFIANQEEEGPGKITPEKKVFASALLNSSAVSPLVSFSSKSHTCAMFGHLSAHPNCSSCLIRASLLYALTWIDGAEPQESSNRACSTCVIDTFDSHSFASVTLQATLSGSSERKRCFSTSAKFVRSMRRSISMLSRSWWKNRWATSRFSLS